jgi:Peptidase family S41
MPGTTKRWLSKVYADSRGRYNNLFPSHAAGFSGTYGGGAWTNHLGLWPGAANQTLEFANGTSLTVETTASLSMKTDFQNITDGESLFRMACMPDPDSSSAIRPATHHSQSPYRLPSSGPLSFPPPVLHHRKDLIQGYYLHETEFQDVVVLQVPTFKLDGESPVPFARTARDFVERAIADGKKKIILDLSGNGGGDINLGLNLFQIFFPSHRIYSATRFRATELINYMGQIFSSQQARDLRGSFPLDLPLVSHRAVTPDQKDSFDSWEDLYGPSNILGTRMSNIYATFNMTTASTEEDPISGYGGIVPGLATQPFSLESIAIVCLPRR